MTTNAPAPRALIADDQQDVLEALRLLLKNEGFQTETATSPKGVIEAIQAHDFDLLLIDLNYARDTTSGREGLDLLSEIQRIDNSLPVVLMTAWGSVELAVQAMQSGGRDFIQKPWDNDRLLTVLRRQLEEGKMLREEKRKQRASDRLIRELDDAREIQQRLLPTEMPKLAGCEIEAAWQPVSAVGGDYFDAIKLSDTCVAFCVADVSGKGLPAALLMSNIQATVKAFAHDTTNPAEMCSRINRVLCDNIGSEKFITFFYGVLDVACRRLRFTNAGHIPPILVHSDGTQVSLSDGGTVLGILRNAPYVEGAVDVNAGDRIVLITDGITEANNGDGEEFGEERLASVLQNATAAGILDSVFSFAGQDLQDDATVLVVSVRF